MVGAASIQDVANKGGNDYSLRERGSESRAEEAPMNGGLDIQDVSIEVQLFKRGKGGYDFSLRERGSETRAEEAPPERMYSTTAGMVWPSFFMAWLLYQI
jgi:hypothetical protein